MRRNAGSNPVPGTRQSTADLRWVAWKGMDRVPACLPVRLGSPTPTAPYFHVMPRTAVPTRPPRAVRCPNCQIDALLAYDPNGRPFLLDPVEVVPRMTCPECKGREIVCGRCNGTRRVGEALAASTPAVTIGEDGIAHRRPTDGRGRKKGHAVHRFHACQR